MEKEDVIRLYEKTESMKQVRRETGLHIETIRRILIDAGIAPSERAEEAMRLYDQGMTVSQVAVALGVSEKRAASLQPYRRGSYAVGEKSENARRIVKCRSKKKEDVQNG